MGNQNSINYMDQITDLAKERN